MRKAGSAWRQRWQKWLGEGSYVGDLVGEELLEQGWQRKAR